MPIFWVGFLLLFCYFFSPYLQYEQKPHEQGGPEDGWAEDVADLVGEALLLRRADQLQHLLDLGDCGVGGAPHAEQHPLSLLSLRVLDQPERRLGQEVAGQQEEERGKTAN